MIEPGKNGRREGRCEARHFEKTGIHLTWILPPRPVRPVRQRAAGPRGRKTPPRKRMDGKPGVNRRRTDLSNDPPRRFHTAVRRRRECRVHRPTCLARLPVDQRHRPREEASFLYALFSPFGFRRPLRSSPPMWRSAPRASPSRTVHPVVFGRRFEGERIRLVSRIGNSLKRIARWGTTHRAAAQGGRGDR